MIAELTVLLTVQYFQKCRERIPLGLCKVESARQVFPLTGRYARQFAAHRLVLVGDAAHTIHQIGRAHV